MDRRNSKYWPKKADVAHGKTVIGYGMQEGEMTVRVNPETMAD
jgi:hypothetical protein